MDSERSHKRRRLWRECATPSCSQIPASLEQCLEQSHPLANSLLLNTRVFSNLSICLLFWKSPGSLSLQMKEQDSMNSSIPKQLQPDLHFSGDRTACYLFRHFVPSFYCSVLYGRRGQSLCNIGTAMPRFLSKGQAPCAEISNM